MELPHGTNRTLLSAADEHTDEHTAGSEHNAFAGGPPVDSPTVLQPQFLQKLRDYYVPIS